jgi:hypothetical protein
VQEVRKLGGAIAVDIFEDSRIALLKVSRLFHEQSGRSRMQARLSSEQDPS